MNSFNLADVFVALGRHHLDRPALISGSRQLTFAELVAASSQAAHALAARGIGPNQNVGLALRDGMDVVVYLLALWMIDAIGVVIDFRSPQGDRATLADEFDLVAIVGDTAPLGAPYAAIGIGGEWRETVARQSTMPPGSRREGNGIALISMTSGTTGRPLGLLVRHEDTFRRLAHTASFYAGGTGKHLNLLPFHFSAGRGTVISKLVSGWTVHLYPPLFSTEELVTDIVRIAPDSLMMVPTMLRSVIQYAEERGTAAPLFPSLKQFPCAGSMTLPQEKRAALRLLSPVYSERYATSPSGGIAVLKSEDVEAHADTVGRLGPYVRCEIVDENDNPLPFGSPGHIRVRTPTMVAGTYKDRTRPNGDRLKDGWVYPGDLGVLRADGFLSIVGRSAETIIRGGGNVHPSEIESVIINHPAVREVYAVGYAHDREGEEIGAVVVTKGDVTENELVAFSRAHLPPDKRPRRFLILDAAPLTSVGKADKKAMQKLFDSQ